jgi:hypothetical protein
VSGVLYTHTKKMPAAANGTRLSSASMVRMKKWSGGRVNERARVQEQVVEGSSTIDKQCGR